MSWDGYITNLLATKHVSEAAIIGHAGDVWATSSGMQFQPAEIKALVGGFADTGSGLLATGVKLAGTKYMAISISATQVLAKKGNCGLACFKTTQAIVAGLYREDVQPGQCTTAVGKVADYLKEAGF